MNRILKVIIWTVTVPIGLFILFIIYSVIVEFRPEPKMKIDEYSHLIYPNHDDKAESVLPDTLKIMTWNIGYAGLGDNMDYFYDGGKQVRDSRERTLHNLNDIISVLKSENADVYFLQEVDMKAKRSYYINQIDTLCRHFPDYHVYYARNYKSWFVPIPVREPIGQVDGGLVIMAKYHPDLATRFQYPSRFPFPMSLFNLKRCLLALKYNLPGGKMLMLGNTHCTAFDSGDMRKKETGFLKDFLYGFNDDGGEFIVGGDWNQYPPEYIPSEEELENEFFRPEKLDEKGMHRIARIACDYSNHTARFNDFVYSESSTETLLDFFVVSNAFTPLSVETKDLKFHSSDHNPVVLRVALK